MVQEMIEEIMGDVIDISIEELWMEHHKAEATHLGCVERLKQKEADILMNKKYEKRLGESASEEEIKAYIVLKTKKLRQEEQVARTVKNGLYNLLQIKIGKLEMGRT